MSGGLSAVARAMGERLCRHDEVRSGDAIVVLGGAPRWRTPAASALWRAKVAPVVVAVGGSDGHREALRTAAALAEAGLPEEAVVVVPHDAPGTWEEASRVAEVARDRRWTRVLVVTSPYHTRRAGKMFERALPDGVAVIMVPATDDPWTAASWWRTPLHRRLTVFEVLKFASWRSGLRRAWVRLR
jgi:uncharacterized SAM-binding protein YcdF (DUF218 family)